MRQLYHEKVFIVVPVFNRLAFTKKCLRSIKNQTYRNVETILIDDGSIDGTESYVTKYFPKVHIIKGDGNWWWTKSMYMGVEYALRTAKKHDFVLEMNNDCYFGKNYISQLLSTAKKYPKSVIGSLCVRAQKPKEVVEAGVRIHWPTGLVYGVAQTISNQLDYYKNMEVIGGLDALPGKGTLIPIDVIKEIGNFNYKKLPHYIADYEFANRAKRYGHDLFIDTRAIVKHYWEATGISADDSGRMRSYRQAWNLLFGRRSMSNIVDWVTFLFLSCPKKHLGKNLYLACWKLALGIMSVPPFYYLKTPIKIIIELPIKAYHFIKIKLNRPYLYVVQFPEYHINKNMDDIDHILYVTTLKILQFPRYHLQGIYKFKLWSKKAKSKLNVRKQFKRK